MTSVSVGCFRAFKKESWVCTFDFDLLVLYANRISMIAFNSFLFFLFFSFLSSFILSLISEPYTSAIGRLSTGIRFFLSFFPSLICLPFCLSVFSVSFYVSVFHSVFLPFIHVFLPFSFFSFFLSASLFFFPLFFPMNNDAYTRLSINASVQSYWPQQALTRSLTRHRKSYRVNR